jgi:peptidyl-prolyl cis-trans isomerase A (cyclophilin A)
METLAAGFEKQKADCVTNSFKEVMVNKQKLVTVSVHYEGSLETGKVFDSSYPRKNQSIQIRHWSSDRRMNEGIALKWRQSTLRNSI